MEGVSREVEHSIQERVDWSWEVSRQFSPKLQAQQDQHAAPYDILRFECAEVVRERVVLSCIYPWLYPWISLMPVNLNNTWVNAERKMSHREFFYQPLNRRRLNIF